MSIMGLLDIGKTGLITANLALTTVAHNTANVDTEGYTRQTVVLQNNPTDSKVVAGTTGTGVKLVEVQRMYDSFQTLQIRNEKANKAYWDAYQQGSQRIDDIFNEAADGSVGASMQDFFKSWQELEQNPSGFAERSSLLNKSDYFSSRIGTAYTTLENERSEIYQNSQVSVRQVNSLTSQISSINNQIAQAPGSLDLLDQRDKMVEDLNKLVGVSTYSDQFGKYFVMIGGKPLVSGDSSFNMRAQTDENNSMRFYLDYPNISDKEKDVTASIASGELKAAIDLRDKQMTGIMNQLNAFAIDLTDAVNYYHRQGYGADGTTGNDFFKPLLEINSDSNPNSGGAVTSVRVTDVNTASPKTYYKLDYIGDGDYTALADGPDPEGTIDDKTDYQQEGSNSGIYWRVRKSTDGLSWTTVDPAKVGVTRDDSITVDGKNNSISIDEGGNTAIVGIPAGTYTHDGLAAAIKTALENATGSTNTYTVTYDSVNRFFSITNDAGPDNLSIKWSDPSTTAEQLLGFNSVDASLAAGDTISSDRPLFSNAYRTLEFEGMSVRIDGNQSDLLSAPSAVTPNETFNIKLNENAARDMKVSLTDPQKIAAAGGDQVTIGGSNNSISFTEDANPAVVPPATTAPASTYITAVIPSGTYSREQLAVELQKALEAASAAAGNNFTYSVSYDAATKKYSIYNGYYDPISGDITQSNPRDVLIDWTNAASSARGVLGFNSNSAITTPALAGGTPAVQGNSAVSNIAVYPIVPGDNSTAAIIAGLENQGIITGAGSVSRPGASPDNFYKAVVSNVATDTSSAGINQQFHTTMLEQLEQRRQQSSGVSLDEEAADLIKYQKLYQASAKLISMGNQLLDALLNIIGS